MDFDIEMEDAAVELYPVEEPTAQDILPIDDTQEPGEVEDTPKGTSFEADEQKPILNKVHIRGVDTLNPADIKAYVQEHYAASSFDRIEWIDDASANLLFKSDFTAAEALIALCAVEIADVSQLPPLELLPAKPYSQKPDAVLLVRFAAMGDRKQSGAAARSRFYLLHPEYDPEERRRRGDSDRGKYRDRDDDRYRRSGRRRVDRWEDEAPETFDVSLYDDDEAALAKRSSPQRLRRRSMSRSPSIDSGLDRYARQNRDKELFPDHRPRERNELSSRNRSASPARSRDGDQAMETSREHGAASRNRDRARSIKDRLERDNSSKELFPSKVSTGPATAQMDRVDLTETITKRLSDRITRPSPSGINIRGIASQRSSEQGFVIKGTAASARELFPDKLDNNPREELFSDKLEKRRPRQRAEDLFH